MYETFSVKVRGVSLAVTTALTCLSTGSALAWEFDQGAFYGNVDTTISVGASQRVQGRDKDIICIANGGTAFGCNSDDGTLNYNKESFSQVTKFTTDVEINHKTGDYGAFFRFKGFVDNEAGNTQRTPLPDDASDLVESGGELLDAYVWSEFDVGQQPAIIRFGKHVVSWGESTFIQGGINAINPIDVSAFRLPGSEIKEALLPVNMLSGSLGITDDITVEAFYQLDWEETVPDPSGSYFSTNDFATEGGRKAVVSGFGDIADSFGFAKNRSLAVFDTPFPLFPTPFPIVADLTTPVPVPPFPPFTLSYAPGDLLSDEDFLTASRGADDEPEDEGQWGVALRYFSEDLNDTEFGIYYMNYHSRLPIISAKTGTPTGVTNAFGAAARLQNVGNTTAAVGSLVGAGIIDPGDAVSTITSIIGAVAGDIYYDTANYFIEYPEDIQLLGVSFNTNAGLWALQGEYSYKHDVPLQIDDVELLLAAATPISGLAAYTLDNQVGTFGTNQYVKGYIQKNVSQAQATASKIFSNVMGADQFVLVAEAAVTHVHDMPSKSTLRLNGPGTFTSGNPRQSAVNGAHPGKPAEDSDAFPDDTSWGYRLLGRWTFNNAIKSINLIPRVAWQHDVDGITPGPGGNFIEDRKAITLGLTGTYKNQWSADMAYTSFFGAGRHNLLNDRDFVSVNVKYSF